MSGMRAFMETLSAPERKRLAHELVLALDGEVPAHRSDSRETAGDLPAASSMPAEDGVPVPAATPMVPAGPRPRTGGPEARAPDETASSAERSVQAGEAFPPQGRGITVTYGAGGKTVRMRREPGGPAAEKTEPETQTVPDAVEEEQRMRDISRYFCRDSRRYDPGFTRY